MQRKETETSICDQKVEIFFHIPYVDYVGPPQSRQCTGITVFVGYVTKHKGSNGHTAKQR